MEQTTIELINAAIDGELDGDGRRRLEKLVGEDERVASYLDEMRAIAVGLSTLDRSEAPAGFRDRVMQSLPPLPPVVTPQATSRATNRPGALFERLLENVRSVLLPKPALRLAVGFVGGLLIGVGLTVALTDGGLVDSSRTVGSIGAVNEAGATQQVAIELVGTTVRGTVTLVKAGDHLEAEFVSAGSTLEGDPRIAFLYDSSTMVFGSFEELTPPGEASLSAAPGRTTVHLADVSRFVVQFEFAGGDPGSIAIELHEYGSAVAREVVGL